LDTNVIIYHLRGEDEAIASRCRDLLRRAAEDEVDLSTSELVVAEAVWVLETQAELTRDVIRKHLVPITALPGLHLPHKQLWPRIFDLYCEKRVDFIDAYNAVMMERAGVTEIYSYDRDFDKIAGIRRVTP
jgi:predicted nucleic acid-binding protein